MDTSLAFGRCWFCPACHQKNVQAAADALNRFATWMATYVQRTGHYREEQERSW